MSRISHLLFFMLMPVLCTACAGARAPAAGAPASAAGEPPPIRLYVLDCGRIEINDMGFFSGSGEPTGQAGTLTVPCFLIQHPQGVFLWDTGLSDSIAQAPGADPVGNRTYVDTPLSTQLRQLGLDHQDVRYVAFSHLHADHAGNANAFTSSTWILQRREFDWATQTPAPLGVDATVFSAYRTAKLQLLDGDADVFGDGSVRIIQTPGHTPGHQSLVVRLQRAGTFVLSGDLCHTRENWRSHVVPHFNLSRPETLASFERVEALIQDTHGSLLVQHAPEDIRAMPKFPAYLE
ncbi:N-acyl homoserine lactonase family protein [Archangium lansingense]|uniref:N-acyl homoserine lactonase family protein n=1 Tax=Archangium lansingense TaxID=2995310 RepID=A0ABT4AGL8_9BACT|nr:N-acyl homoserine lactonase family protein [Archangium lansinium]MCY1080828.1 N-acyl homoserine lactonase family protein [Archangium lansinium]